MSRPTESSYLSTQEAATLLLRKPQTLRSWAVSGRGPISPIRVHGRLAWLASDVQGLIERGGRHERP